MSFLKEFKTFAMRGNVVDMAVGIIIGGAFGKIVSSLVSDIIMPPIGMLIGGMNFSNLHIVLQKAHMNEATGKMPTRSVSVVFIAVNRFCPATAKIVPRCVLLSAGIAVRSLFRPPEPPHGIRTPHRGIDFAYRIEKHTNSAPSTVYPIRIKTERLWQRQNSRTCRYISPVTSSQRALRPPTSSWSKPTSERSP